MSKASSTHCSMPSKVNLANGTHSVPSPRYERVLAAREKETHPRAANPHRTPLEFFRERPRARRPERQDPAAPAHHHPGLARVHHPPAPPIARVIAAPPASHPCFHPPNP